MSLEVLQNKLCLKLNNNNQSEFINKSDLSKEINKKRNYMENTNELKDQLSQLQEKLTGDMFQDMDIKDQIHNIEMKLNGTKPTDSHFDCVGCGS